MNTDQSTLLATAFFAWVGVDATTRKNARESLLAAAPAPVAGWVKKHLKKDLAQAEARTKIKAITELGQLGLEVPSLVRAILRADPTAHLGILPFALEVLPSREVFALIAMAPTIFLETKTLTSLPDGIDQLAPGATLDIRANRLGPVSNAAVLAGLVDLELRVHYGEIDLEQWLPAAPAVVALELDATRVLGLENLQTFSKLRRLRLRMMAHASLGFLRGLPLEDLDLEGHSPIEDLGALGTLTSLRRLSLCSRNGIESGALHGLSGLEHLDLCGTLVDDLSFLSRSPCLRSLSLKFTQVSDLSALRGLPLETLDLSTVPKLTDLSAVLGLPTLRELRIYNPSPALTDQLAQLAARPGLTLLR